MNPRSYGPVARTALLVGMSEGGATQASFAAHLTAKLKRTVTRDTVANWMADRENVPGDAVIAMAEHVPSSARAVFQVLVDGAEIDGQRFMVVERPKELAEGEQPLVLAAGVSGAAGLLVQHVLGEEHPDSDGGRTRTPGELSTRKRRIAEMQHALAQLEAQTDAELAVLGRKAMGGR
jgi:hypothetical protein